MAGINDFVREALASTRARRVAGADGARPRGAGTAPRARRHAGRLAQRQAGRARRRDRAPASTSPGSRPRGAAERRRQHSPPASWSGRRAPRRTALLGRLPLIPDHGRLVVDEQLAWPARPGVWALGDCAVIPDRAPASRTRRRRSTPSARAACSRTTSWRHRRPAGAAVRVSPPSASSPQWQAHRRGENSRGQLLRVRRWWFWRSDLLMELPRLDRKVRVALDSTWTSS